MPWYYVLPLTSSGRFLVNAVPHFTKRRFGRRFPSPFRFRRPAKERLLARRTQRCLWGTFNVAIAYLLVCAWESSTCVKQPASPRWESGACSEGIQLAGLVWKGSRPRIGRELERAGRRKTHGLHAAGDELLRLRGAFRFQLALVFF